MSALYPTHAKPVNCGDYLVFEKNPNLQRLFCCLMVLWRVFLGQTEKNLRNMKKTINILV
jgi:hypothetical protein